ncbi:MAG: hypothetical protein FWD69_10435 [Polyangiaceae bacterium]|nr:hypothetical protein [Polyangiaceae bacterium]
MKTDINRAQAIEEVLSFDLTQVTPAVWQEKFDETTTHLTHLPAPSAARYVPRIAKKFGVSNRIVSEDIKKKHKLLVEAVAPPHAYDPDAHPAIGCTREGEFWIAVAGPHPTTRGSDIRWLGMTASGELRVGPPEPTNLKGAAQLFVGQWSDKSRLGFLTSTNPPVLITTYLRVKELVDKYVEFPHDDRAGFAAVVALWIIGTYLHPIFGVFPYLTIEGAKGSGKSRLLELIAATAFNGFRTPSPTAAVLCRIVAAARATLCLDETETLHSNSDDTASIRALLNDGYKHGGRVPRVSRDGGIEFFDAFSPKALAGIAGLNDVTADRAIRVVMVRASDPEKGRRSIDPRDEEIAVIRDALYETALTYANDIRHAYEHVKLPSELINRSAELWRPLFAIATVIDATSGTELVNELTPLAIEDTRERGELDPLTTAVADALWYRATSSDESDRKIRPGAVADEVFAMTRQKVSPEWVGRQFIRRLGFKRSGRDSNGAYYYVDPAILSSRLERIGWVAPEPEVKPWMTSARTETSSSNTTSMSAGDSQAALPLPDGSDGSDGSAESPSPFLMPVANDNG